MADSDTKRPLGLKWVGFNGKTIIRTPDGVPEGWYVSVDEDGAPVVARQGGSRG